MKSLVFLYLKRFVLMFFVLVKFINDFVMMK